MERVRELFLCGAIISIVIHSSTCNLEPTFTKCCNLGSNWATEGLKCTQFPAPVAGISAEQQSSCLSAVEICCIRGHRESQCVEGINAAQDGSDCIVVSKIGGEHFKDCCEACKLGMISGSMGNGCRFTKFAFGQPWDLAYETCCINTSPSTRPTVVIPNTLSASTATDMSPGISTQVLESLCDLLPGELCAHICVPTPKSYTCKCRPGFSLMSDGKSCEQENLAARCLTFNPCAHNCIDTGLAIECSCRQGFQLDSDKRSCSDVNECQVLPEPCLQNQQCRNELGNYVCVNPNGTISQPLASRDKDKPPNPKNEVGAKTCPVGYEFNYQSQVCDDIDECLLNQAECGSNSVCQNTIASYVCVRVPVEGCLPGFRLHKGEQTCKDINECAEALDNCNRVQQHCINTEGSFRCQEKTEKSQCPAGYKFNTNISSCEDINECEEHIYVCNRELETCINEPGGYRCGKVQNQGCQPGFRLLPSTNNCIDVDECSDHSDSPCDSNQNCINTPGSYTCSCKIGYEVDHITQACTDINECQVNQHDCLPSQRCDNTIGSFQCIRFTSCGTGYTLNAESGLCEDDDECLLGTDTCRFQGPIFQCRNTLGSFRCERKRCEGKLRLNSAGECIAIGSIAATTHRTSSVATTTTVVCPPGFQSNQFNQCADVNECELQNPCRRNQRCYNTNGSYRCINNINCNGGFNLNEAGTQCVDIDECTTGSHECGRDQTCQNLHGGYVCQCPPGHTVTPNKECEDIDECSRYTGQVCAINAVCENTPGSYRCVCKQGFKQGKDVKTCVDIDECVETPGLCHQTCVNNWGSYYCTCNPGYLLSSDNRTCSDVDECERFKEMNLCVGLCINQPGSYSCQCPSGYKLGSDGRTCQDIDECLSETACRSTDEICLNTRGGFKCNTINCPLNFVKDSEHKNRCKRESLFCRERNQACLRLPMSYSFNFITFVSNYAIPPSGQLNLFTMRGPKQNSIRARFSLDMLDVHAPTGVRRISKNFFRLDNSAQNQAVIALIQPIPGPQEIELQLNMELHQNGVYGGSAVAKLFIYVSQYEF